MSFSTATTSATVLVAGTCSTCASRSVTVAAYAGQHHALREPADIVTAALEGQDLTARRTLARFCAVLGSVAGDAALIHGARTVMIAGGIVPRFIPFLKSSAFRERFLAKGRFAAYLEGVSVQLVVHPQPGLLGAAGALIEEKGKWKMENGGAA